MYTEPSVPVWITPTKDVIQGLAVVIGGYWSYRVFVKQRLGFERIDLSQEVVCVALSSQVRLLRVILTMKNVGSVLVRPTELNLSIQRVLPADVELVRRAEEGDAPFAPYPAYGNWEDVRTYAHDFRQDDLGLEPGEQERYPFDFTVPASLRMIQVHSELWSGTGRAQEYWDETSLHDISRCVA